MDRAKTIIFAGIGALAALTIYGAASTKKASSDSGRSNRVARIEALMNEGAVKYRPSFFRRAVRRHEVVENIAGLETAKTVTEVAPTEPAKLDAKAEEAKKAAEKKAADEKKKKEDEAKKKKKKKKKKKDGDTSADASAPGDQAAKTDDEEKKKDDPTAVAASGGTTTSYYAQPPVDPNKMPETVEEWIVYLTNYPSNEKTAKFIQMAQTNSVKGEIFFPVCEKLLSMDQRLQAYSVLALGSVMNVTSFEYLANVSNEQSFSDKLKAQAGAYLNQYARVEYVRFAGAAVLSKDSVAADAALRIIDRSLPNLRTASASSTTPVPTTTEPATGTGATTTPATTQATPATTAAAATITPATRAPASSIGKIYEAIYADLAQASSQGVDSSIRSAAQAMASQIQSLLASIDPTPAQATAKL